MYDISNLFINFFLYGYDYFTDLFTKPWVSVRECSNVEHVPTDYEDNFVVVGEGSQH